MSGDCAEIPLLHRLQQNLASCARSIESGDLSQSQSSVSELVTFLDSVSEAALSDPGNEEAKSNALEVLSKTYGFLCSPALDQAVVDALSFELPKAVSKFAAVSGRCLEIADCVVSRFIEKCSPRDMLSVICEGLDSLSKTSESAACFYPLLGGLVKVFSSIQRRQFEQLKATVPVVIKVLKAVSSESDNDDSEVGNLFDKAIDVADSIHSVSTKLEGEANEKLLPLLGSYILQIMALVSISTRSKLSGCLHLVLKVVHFIPFCGLSYLGLITGSDVDTMTNTVLEGSDGQEDYISGLSYIKLGAALSVIWGLIFDEVAQASKEDLRAVKCELQTNQTKRWQAISMLKHILSSADLPWEFKRHAIKFLLCMTSTSSHKKLDEHADCSPHMTSLFSALQAVIVVIIYESDAELRKNAFDAFKRVLADIPTSQRFDILKALITKSESSSMIAILLDIVREELRTEACQRTSMEKDATQNINNNACQHTSFWSPDILELVEGILRPPKGGPPTLPENGDAVLSALNLYRFVLMTESAGNTNYTGVVSKNNLQKVYNEWLLPLRTLVTGIIMENKSCYDQMGMDAICALNPIELVLYRCIELTEQKLISVA